jgi:hypothetical protein
MPKVRFSSHPPENKHITSKQAHFAYRNKGLTYFHLLPFTKTKKLQRTHFVAHRLEMEPMPPCRGRTKRRARRIHTRQFTSSD